MKILSKYFYGKKWSRKNYGLGKSKKKNFRYAKGIVNKFGRIFSSEGGNDSPLEKYSSKMYSIIKKLKKVKELLLFIQIILMVVVFLALALEEAGITRYGSTNSLFKTQPTSNFKVKWRKC